MFALPEPLLGIPGPEPSLWQGGRGREGTDPGRSLLPAFRLIVVLRIEVYLPDPIQKHLVHPHSTRESADDVNPNIQPASREPAGDA
jgi:hypothetical protein